MPTDPGCMSSVEIDIGSGGAYSDCAHRNLTLYCDLAFEHEGNLHTAAVKDSAGVVIAQLVWEEKR